MGGGVKCSLSASYVGYRKQTIDIDLAVGDDITVNFKLQIKEDLDEVVVIGSRGINRSRMDSPVPVDVIDAKLIKEAPQVTLSQILNYAAPSFNSNIQVLNDGTDHIDPASLRGLGPDHVLVLINGKRRHTTSLVNVMASDGRGSVSTDLNAIPTSAIKKIEILRDGAAAQYGSDAIAGVINIILEDNTEHLTANASVGGFASKNSEGSMDGQTVDANINWGTKLSEKGGFINFAANYQTRKPFNRQKEFTGTIFQDFNRPDLYPNPTGADITDEELARRGETRADYIGRVGQSETSGGAVVFNGVLPLENEFEIYSFGGLNYRYGESAVFPRNPYQLHQNVKEIYPDGYYLPLTTSNNYDKSLVAGLRGKINGWDVDLSNTFGNNTLEIGVTNSLNASMGKSSPTVFNAGGYGFTQNTLNFDLSKNLPDILQGTTVAFGAEHRYENYTVFAGEEASYRDYGKVLELTTDNGDVVGIPDLNGNKQSLFAENGRAYAGGAQGFTGVRPDNEVNKNRSSIAAYANIEANILPDLLVAGALRFENYSDFGSTLNWKFAARYRINRSLSFRSSVNTGFRAPSLHQRYFNQTSSIMTDGNLIQSGTFTNDSPVAELLGIPKLKEEQSIQYSIGTTASIGKFKATVDGYFTHIDNRIILTGHFYDADIQPILQLAGASSARFFANAIDLETKGIDIVLSYKEHVGKGTLRLDLSGTLSKTSIVGDIHTSEKLAGKEDTYLSYSNRILIESGSPRVKGNLLIDYSLNKWSFLLRNSYFGKVDVALNQPPVETYSAKVLTDLTVGYNILREVNLSIGANNLFDIYSDPVVDKTMQYSGLMRYGRQQFGFGGRYVFARISITL
jgi:iron complex outermembrane receptor protein